MIDIFADAPVHLEIEVTRGEIYGIRGDFTLSTANPLVEHERVGLGPSRYATSFWGPPLNRVR